MKLFGSLTKLVSLVFQKSAATVTVQPTQTTGDAIINIPDLASTTDSMVLAAANQALTTKTYNGVSLTSGTSTFTLTKDSATLTRSGAHTATLTTTNNTNVTLPTTGTLATLAGSESLSAKTLVEPLIDNFAALNHEAAPAAAAAGTLRVFAKSDNSLYTMDPNGVESQVGSGSGQGEKNYITNPSMKSATTGWNTSDAAKLNLTRSITAAELPREYTTATGVKILSAASADSTNAYIYFDFSLDDVDLNKKLKISWAQKMVGAYASGSLTVYIAAQSDRTTALHTPVTTAIANVDGVFTTSFDSASTAALSLVIKAPGNMADNVGLVISDVVVGPGSIVTGAVVGPWKTDLTFTPDATAFGTISLKTFSYQRVGSSMVVKGTFKSGTLGAAVAAITLPTGYTIDSSALSSTASAQSVGSYYCVRTGAGAVLSSSGRLGAMFYDGSTTSTVYFGQNAGSNAFVKLNGNGTAVWDSSDSFSVEFVVPIAEWAGSGTVNLGEVQNAAKRTKTITSMTISGVDDTGADGSCSLQDCFVFFHSDSSNNWYMSGRINFACTSRARTYYQLTLSGITFKNTTNSGGQAMNFAGAGITQLDCFAKDNGSHIQLEHASATKVQYGLTFSNLALASEPTTYTTMANMETNTWQPVGFGAATATSSGLVKQGVNVAAAAGATPTKAEFDALLTSLKNAGIIASS
jgi:hypothetical protein